MPDFVRKLLSADKVSVIQKLGGLTADNFIVSDGSASYVLKNYKGKSESDIVFEENLLKELAAQNLPVVQPLNFNGKTRFYEDGSFFSLFPLVDGGVLHGRQLKAVHFKEIAKVMPSFHAINSLKTNLKMSEEIYGKKRIDAFYSLPNQTLPRNISRLLSLKKELLESVESDSFTSYFNKKHLVHGDFHNENILFSNDRLAALLDFDLCHLGNRMEDVFNFLWLAFFSGAINDETVEQAKSYLNEMNAVYAFTPDELSFGFSFMLYSFATSVFIEQNAIKGENPLFSDLIERDLNKAEYLIENRNALFLILNTAA